MNLSKKEGSLALGSALYLMGLEIEEERFLKLKGELQDGGA